MLKHYKPKVDLATADYWTRERVMEQLRKELEALYSMGFLDYGLLQPHVYVSGFQYGSWPYADGILGAPYKFIILAGV